MAAPALDFWFEFASPYTYIAVSRIESLATEAGVSIHWKPFLLGPVLKHHGSKPMILEQPWKVAYWLRDFERLCGKYGLSCHYPSRQPFSLLAARIALVGLERGWGIEFIKAVFHAEFGEGKDIASKHVLAPMLEALGLDAEETFAVATSNTIKQQLREQTSRAIERGVFGSPTFYTQDGEMFWGQDRLEDALAWATGAPTDK